jgi:hypothetical protein
VHCSSGNMTIILLRTSDRQTLGILLQVERNINKLIFNEMLFTFWIKNTVWGFNVFYYDKLMLLDSAVVELRDCVLSSLTV